MGTKTIRFERQKLYEQVWEKPMTTLVAEYGLSDVGLRKICKRLSIPLPPQGYHLRMHKGQRPPLPPSKDGVKEHVTHIYEPEQRSVNDLPQPVEVPEIAFEELPENRIIVSDTPATLHQHIAEAKSQLKKNKPDNYGRVSTYWKRGNDISVFPESIERALQIMNALVRALVKRGFTVSVDEKNNATVAKVLDEQIGFRLEERSRQIRHVPTPAELLDEKKHSYRHYPTYDYIATGEFSLKISGAYQYEKICKDDKKGKIEEKLNFFIIAMIKRALQVKDDRTRRAREEEIRRAREQKRWEMDSLIRKEKEKVEALKKECAAWHESQRLRAYIRAAYEAGPFDPESPFAKWLVWASLQADRMDPLKNSPPSVLDHDRSHW
ncbi:MAG: hypothetical protein GJV46_15060 [Geobacter sp.]|nr:hypothetical protein [Geobacter sp.]